VTELKFKFKKFFPLHFPAIA